MWDYSVIDLNEAVNRVLGHKEMYKRWLDDFFAAEPLSLIDESFSGGDYDNAHRAVHKLKGTAGNLAILKLFEQARNLDEMIKRKNDFSILKSELSHLKACYKEAENMYRAYPDEIDNFVYAEV